ncbi:MAG: coniferyl aldehyde dehydrogenase [Xanthomonadales bacterium]|nr:coniferyl aldehyde dehydrogenase [Xanthomonadales bacterium]ODU92125.1 MAG: aldehyde dehydrogenase [Rhodanobacter sp. SCN 66-43]OJY86011.1 MAG: coniferyl aldehyde dehydrogenase [Xanthomonadales bacterium 66-474]
MDTPSAGLSDLLHRQREAWRAHTPDRAQRMDDLARLAAAFKARLEDFARATSADFGHRPRVETLLADGVPVVHEIAHVRRHLERWMRARRVGTDATFLPARCGIIPKPLGVVGIISPWNYPVNLALVPLVDALAAGNHVLLKPSEHTPRTSALLAEMLADALPSERVAVVQGGADVAAAFAALPFDHLLFTGSTAVGAKVLAAAAPNLVPVTLELGGKSPAIVAPGCATARNVARIAAGKFLNAGQTCIAPDYVLLHAAERDAFVRHLREYVAVHYPSLRAGGDYASIVNDAQHARLLAGLDEARAAGARVVTLPDDAAGDHARRILAPAVVLDAPDSIALMREEIFGPVLPVVTYREFDEAIGYVNARPRPLSLYVFDDDRTRIARVLAACTAGSVAVNDCVFQFTQSRLPFGGVGPSGMGAYHGHAGFLAFSKQMPVFRQARWSATAWLRPPYGARVERLLRFLLR